MGTVEIIAEKLKQKGWSMNQLAHHSGITQAQISRIMSGKSSNLTLATLRAFARALGCSVVDLLGDEDRKKAA
ncbi:MAG: helix-turn-helix transcriptional regulator [Methylococcaceae bacterium]